MSFRNKLAIVIVFLSASTFYLYMERSAVAGYSEDPFAQTTITHPGFAIETAYVPPFTPEYITFGPNGELLILGDPVNIYELHENGEVTIYASFPQHYNPELNLWGISRFNFDSNGELWYTTNAGSYWRVDSQGQHHRMTAEGASFNTSFVFNSADVIYAVGGAPSTDVHRITPDGQGSVLAEGFGQTMNIGIGPNDEVLIVEQSKGELLQIFEDGSWEIITDGLSFDHTIITAPDGTVYLYDWSGLLTVNLETGEKTPVNWYEPYNNLGANGVFDSDGFLYAYAGNNPLYRIDMAAESVEMIYHPKSNTWGMAVGPDNRVFVGYGARIPGGQSTLYEVNANGELVSMATVPYREITAITFDQQGTGYLATGGPQAAEYGTPEFWGGAIYKINLQSMAVELFYQDPDNHTRSIGVDPTTGFLWWADFQVLKYMDDQGSVHEVNFSELTLADSVSLSFSPSGTLSVLLGYPQSGNLEWHQKIFQQEPDDSWTEVLASDGPDDIFLQYPGIVHCSNNVRYLFGSVLDGELIGKPSGGITYGTWRLEEDNSMTLLAYDSGADIFAANCSSPDNFVYFTHTRGIGRFYQWATDFLYLPAILRP